MLISGARGTGKTALLALIAEEAEGHGRISVSAGCYPGMLEDIYEQTVEKARSLIPSDKAAHVTSVGIGDFFGIEWERDQVREGDWRTRMTRLLGQLAKLNVGLLITVDEADSSLDEMIRLAQIYQLFVRERRKIALLMAGLPHMISSLMQDKSASFLRRAKRQHLGRIPNSQVSVALAETASDGGEHTGADALAEATETADGLAFMLQLVGYCTWEAAGMRDTIETDDARRGALVARSETEERVLEPTFASLSDGDLAFCRAMIQDGSKSRVADLVARLGKGPSNVNTYRSRLIEQGVIGSPRQRVVTFELPLFREYLVKRLGL